MGTVDVIDRDLEARKHLWQGLERLAAPERVGFLGHCCRLAGTGGGVGVKVTGHSGRVGEAYYDLAMLAVAWGVDLYRVCAELESWLKRR